MTLQTGQVLRDRYEVIERLGGGGFGDVYKVLDRDLERPRALKENRETSPEAQRQFKREAQMLAGLSHPNLPHVYDHFIIADQGQYLVMEFIEGDDLGSLLERSGTALPVEQVLGWVDQVCSALTYLHRQQPPVIHRDIKPANIRITPDGRAVLVDFGIAKVFDPARATTLGARAITPGFSPPEQYGQGATDAQSDVYALGATVYTLLTGMAPPESIGLLTGSSPAVPPVHSLNPTTPLQVSLAIQGAMQPGRTQRIRDVEEFRQALTSRPLASKEEEPTLVGTSLRVATPALQPAQPETVAAAPVETLLVPPAAAQAPAPRKSQPAAGAPRPGHRQPAPQRPASRSRTWLWVGALGALALFGLLGIGGVVLALQWFGGQTQAVTPVATQPVSLPEASITPQAVAVEPATPARRPPDPTSTRRPPAPSTAPVAAPAAPPGFKACQVTDVGGIDDKSYNATAWKGVEQARAIYGIEIHYLESQQQTDYEKNIQAFLDDGCNIVITVGFLLGDATQAMAEKNPEARFSIVDVAYKPAIPNVLGQVFATDQAAFLAGYLSAGVTRTGKVGTFGGMQIPPVTTFLDGFALGVAHYNQVHGKKIEVLGWDPAAQTGLFTGNFESTDDGRTMGQTLMDEGADIIFPVAGPVGLGAAAAVLERGNAYFIGVDSDWYEYAPEFRDILLTSVLKKMDVTTFQAIQAVIEGAFAGGVISGNLQNEGVSLAPFHDLDAIVPDELKNELEQVAQAIVAGRLATSP